LLGETFHLAGLVQFDQVYCFEDIVHIFLVDFPEGVVSFPQLGDLSLDIFAIPISLIIFIPTKAVNLLISTFFLTMS
jgi:hypothetical protein